MICANLGSVRAQLASAAHAAHRSVDSITLVAVSKGHGEAAVRAAAALQVRDFGESYLQEALPKLEQLRELPVTWHFIGRIQANKTRPIAEHFHWVHGVDRLKIAERLSAQRPHYAAPLQLCLQVNIAGEASKGGVEPAAASELVQAVSQLPRVQLRGLMGILPAELPSDARREAFAALRTLRDDVGRQCGGLDTLSMGMSDDFADAILEGTTMVRIGSAIFGPRPHTDVG